MKEITIFLQVLIIAVLMSCGPKDAVNPEPVEPVQQTYDNPFEYCKETGTIDAPGPRYTGPEVPEIIAEKLKQVYGAPESAPLDVFINGTYWRCMDGSVYACNVGANLPCQEKGDYSKTPDEGMVNYCAENPGSDFIPMYASGRATVYEWKCTGKSPVIVKQIAETDKEGYIEDIWYKIEP